MLLALVIAAIFGINVIFGYWRANTRKLSLQWISAVHIPVPVAIGLRLWLLGWNWFLLPVFVIDFAAGQYTGGRIRRIWEKHGGVKLTSWLIGDSLRAFGAFLRKNKRQVADS